MLNDGICVNVETERVINNTLPLHDYEHDHAHGTAQNMTYYCIQQDCVDQFIIIIYRE